VEKKKKKGGINIRTSKTIGKVNKIQKFT